MSFLSLERVSKRFGEFAALDQVGLHVEQGTLHAIVGENGAGKTTLMRILYGAIRPDEGELTLNGKAFQPKNSDEAIAAGIGMVAQHAAILPGLSCLENLLLAGDSTPVLDRKAARKRAEELATSVGFKSDWDADAAKLGPAEAQALEILKLLWRDSKVMILDEPTAMLSPEQAESLYETLNRLKEDGRTILVVTHRLKEVMEHCQAVTVLRGGKLIEERKVDQMTEEELTIAIVGQRPNNLPKTAVQLGETVLEMKDLKLEPKDGVPLKGVNLTIRQGEVVGLAGVNGSGQSEILRVLAGDVRPVGTFKFGGQDAAEQSAAWRLARGLRILPEDRVTEAIISDWSLLDNARLGLHRNPVLTKGLFFNKLAAKTLTEKVAARFNTKHASLNQAIGGLSGGNQQRFVAGRMLSLDPKLIVAFQPARGLDIEGINSVYQGIRESAAKGSAALIVGFDLDELLRFCDRVVVMFDGQVFSPPAGKEMDRATLGHMMVAGGEN